MRRVKESTALDLSSHDGDGACEGKLLGGVYGALTLDDVGIDSWGKWVIVEGAIPRFECGRVGVEEIAPSIEDADADDLGIAGRGLPHVVDAVAVGAKDVGDKDSHITGTEMDCHRI